VFLIYCCFVEVRDLRSFSFIFDSKSNEMAEVKNKLCVSHSCCNKGIYTLSDLTGPYDATINPFGWGVGNIQISEVTSSGLTVTSPSGVVYGPYDVLSTLALPSLGQTVTTTPAVPEVLPIAKINTTVSYSPVVLYSDYPVADTAITDTFQLLVTDTVNDVVYKLNTAFDAVGSGFFAYNNGTNLRITAPVGSGSIYNGRTLTITNSAGAIWYIFDTSGVNGVPAITETYVTSLEIDVTDILAQTPAVGEAYSDGYWKFDWVVSGEYGSSIAFQSRCLEQELGLCDVQCCVDGLMANADPSCACKKGGDKKAVNAMLTLEGIKARDCKKEREGAKTLLVKLQDICNNNCKDC
jgi:hypothetical protein